MTATEFPSPCTVETLAAMRRDLQRVVTDLDPAVRTTSDAAELLTELARIERIASGARTLLAQRAADADRWRTDGEKSPEDWLARQTGGSKTDARRTLRTSQHLADLDETRQALSEGRLSTRQAETVAAAAVADPRAEGDLLAAAAREPLSTLQETAGRVRAAADPDPAATQRRVHASRSVRFWDEPDGSSAATVRGTRDQMARLRARVEHERDRQMAHARKNGTPESLDNHTYDAFLTVAGVPGAGPQGMDAPAAERDRRRDRGDGLIVHATLPALLTGRMGDGDFVEIPGVGPYPLAHAQRLLLGDAGVDLVLHHGCDVRNVVTSTRAIRRAIRVAVEARDRGRCIIPGCGRKMAEIHHTASANGFADTGRTLLDELGGLCRHHHDDLTHRGARLTGRHRTGWRWVPPPPDRAHPQGRPSATRRRRERARRRRE